MDNEKVKPEEKTAETELVEVKPAAVEPEEKSTEVKSGETKPVEVEPAEVKLQENSSLKEISNAETK